LFARCRPPTQHACLTKSEKVQNANKSKKISELLTPIPLLDQLDRAMILNHRGGTGTHG